jgi:hypothetical protein
MSTVTTSEAESKTNAWSYFELSNSPVETIRDELEAAVPAEWERIDDAHISILPGFDITPADVDVALDCIALLGVGVVGDDVTINKVVCSHEQDQDTGQPSLTVALDLDIDLHSIRVAQKQWVENYGGSITLNPVSPAVTLFKARSDKNEPLSSEQRGELRKALDDVDVPDTLAVEDLEAETY